MLPGGGRICQHLHKVLWQAVGRGEASRGVSELLLLWRDLQNTVHQSQTTSWGLQVSPASQEANRELDVGPHCFPPWGNYGGEPRGKRLPVQTTGEIWKTAYKTSWWGRPLGPSWPPWPCPRWCRGPLGRTSNQLKFERRVLQTKNDAIQIRKLMKPHLRRTNH